MTRVIGIGNPLRGDDGIGPAVIAALLEETLPPDVEALDAGEAGVGLVGLMEEVDRVILVDAAEMGKAPGTFCVFGPEVVGKGTNGLSAHSVGTGEALQMAGALGCLPESLWIVGVQPKCMAWHIGLSPEISQRLPEIVKAVLALYRQWNLKEVSKVRQIVSSGCVSYFMPPLLEE